MQRKYLQLLIVLLFILLLGVFIHYSSRTKNKSIISDDKESVSAVRTGDGQNKTGVVENTVDETIESGVLKSQKLGKCLDNLYRVDDVDQGTYVQVLGFKSCDKASDTQQWKLLPTGQIQQASSGLCVQQHSVFIKLATCVPNQASQLWTWTKFCQRQYCLIMNWGSTLKQMEGPHCLQGEQRVYACDKTDDSQFFSFVVPPSSTPPSDLLSPISPKMQPYNWNQTMNTWSLITGQLQKVGDGIMQSGELKCLSSGMCLDSLVSPQGLQILGLNACDGSNTQQWWLWQDGGLQQASSSLCAQYNASSDVVELVTCWDKVLMQLWTRSQFCQGTSCQFLNWGETLDKLSGPQCLQGDKQVNVSTCNRDDNSQYFSFTGSSPPSPPPSPPPPPSPSPPPPTPQNWTQPIGAWSLVQCSITTELEASIDVAVTCSRDINDSMLQHAEMLIDQGVTFFGQNIKGRVQAEVSSNLADVFNSTAGSKSKSTMVKCVDYDDGSQFEGGCLWQLVVTVPISDGVLNWKTNFTKCSNIPIQCPPFTQLIRNTCQFEPSLLEIIEIGELEE